MILEKINTKPLLFLILYLNFIPITHAHHGDDDNILLTKPNKINIVKESGKYRTSLTFYSIGDTGITDFSLRIENISSGFYYSDDLELQIVNPNGIKRTPYTPFIDNEYNFKMREFLDEKGEYKLVVRIKSFTDEQEMEFPISVEQKGNENICAWCSMVIKNKKTANYISLNNGDEKQTCCVHCAIKVKNKFKNKLVSIQTVDFVNDQKIDANKALFVKDSSIELKDSMAPYILAFSTIESAKTFQKEYQGNIVSLESLELEIIKKDEKGFTDEEIEHLIFLEEVFYNIKKNYYEKLDIKKLVDLSIEKILEALDKNSTLKKIEPSSLDFIRGFDRDKTIQDAEVFNNRVGYIKINYFGRRTKEDFKKTMITLATKDINGLIIDLRNNPGGNLEEAMQIMQYFVPNDTVLASVNINRQQKRYQSNTDKKWEYPLAILINKETASSAELFAASLRHYKKAIIIGTNSYGKSTIQQSFPINSEYTLFLTTGKSYLPNGKSVDASGIKPDHFVKNEDDQLAKALTIFENAGNKAELSNN